MLQWTQRKKEMLQWENIIVQRYQFPGNTVAIDKTTAVVNGI